MRRNVGFFKLSLCVLPMLGAAALTAAQDRRQESPPNLAVTPVPDAVRARLKLSPFYAQHCDAQGLPVVASVRVNPYALKEAAFLIGQMLDRRDDIRRAMIDSGVRFSVMAVTEMTTDVPEHSDLTPKAYWDRRARGLGATPQRPSVSCGEENLLGLRGDPYASENILIHEFSHAVHEMGMKTADPTFDTRLKDAYTVAMAEGLWKGTYAATNRGEYWAEGTQSWFDTNRVNDGAHGEINTRDEVKAYDPRLAALLTEVYGDREWRYARPADRAQKAHLDGFDASNAPAFVRVAPATTTTRNSRD